MIDGKRFTQLMCQTHTILTADQLLYKFLVDIKLAFPNQSSVLAKCSARTFPSLSIWSNCWQSRPPKMDTCQVKLSRKFFKHSSVFDVLSLLWKQMLQHMGDFGGHH